MPITTILQHQRDREKLNQPDLGTPVVAEEDHNIRNKDTIKERKTAAVAERWVAPDSTRQAKKLNNSKSSCPKVATLSTKKDSSKSCKVKQTNSNRRITRGKTTAQPRATPIDRHSPRTMATVNCDLRRASCGMQQNTQPSRKSNKPRQNAPSEHHGGPPSPTDSVYEVARRAVNFLDIHKTQDTAPQDTAPRNTVLQYTAPQNAAPQDTTPRDTTPRDIAPRDMAPSIIDAQQVILNNTIGETPPASHSSAQTSPVSHKREKTPPIRWSTIQTYPSCRDAIVFSDKKREREMISRQQRTTMQRPRPKPSNGPRPKSKSAAARRRAMLKHSVTYTLPAANPQTPAAPDQPAVYHPTMTSNQAHPPPTPVHSVMTLRPGPASYPQLMPRPPTASQRMANTQPPARWQPIYPKSTHPESKNPQSGSFHTHHLPSAYSESTHSQPLSASQTVGVSQEMTASEPTVTSQQATTVAKETNRERARRLRREAQLRKEASLLCRDGHPLDDPLGTTIEGFRPSVGNRVVEHLIKHNPEAVAASKLSHTIPKETAVHYNSILSWQAENAQTTGDPSPHGHPTHFNNVESRAASSDSGPASREAQTLAVIVVPIRSAPVSQHIVNTEIHPHHSHSNTLVPQRGIQSHPYSRVPSGESDNAPNGYGNYSSASTQQSTYEQRERTVMDNRDCDIQEISRQDWQAANKDSPRYRANQRAQSVVASAPYERTMASSASASSVNSQSIPEPFFEDSEDMLCFGESEDMMLPLSPQSPIRQNPVSISAQAQVQTVRRPSNQASPIYGGIHKRKPSRASRTSPPQTTMSRIAISQLVHSSVEASKACVPQTAVRRIAISQLVLPSTVPRIAISQLVHSSPVPRISISQLVHSSPVPRVAISQLVHSSPVPRISISQLVHSSNEVPKTVVPQNTVPQATMPRTSPRTPLPSARPDKHRRVRRSRGGMWLSQDDLDRWQEERKDPYRLPSFKHSFNDVAMTDCQTSHEKQASSEPAGGVFSLDAYRINPVASCARNWLLNVYTKLKYKSHGYRPEAFTMSAKSILETIAIGPGKNSHEKAIRPRNQARTEKSVHDVPSLLIYGSHGPALLCDPMGTIR
ncbi:hypothetical protein M431DRAFT_476925 [Trichoderma harzianum CBS 226.95]|uniref:Uncharacterized protein n=1 Tax=Trichoderma harzianum CBS 226.95 TaxID=983964 RepID=A0A2T4ATR3_TRIHA|nr:hypothetical protein M431DRAFT_476925 [Trichoderma harzianum CBS 226.95]PTB60429.1 hypothetical protein M431DRAFT_476925 [Trichoderma harzianum CBS 226.95]